MANSIISEIQRTIGMNDSASIWMGLDVHKHSYHIALVSGESRPVTWSAPPIRPQLLKLYILMGFTYRVLASKQARQDSN
jgi:hypothetical protein